MSKKSAKAGIMARQSVTNYDDVLVGIVQLLETARRASARTVNTIMTTTYWEVGRRIVESEQGGNQKARYGEVLLERLAVDLTHRFKRGFGRENLRLMRRFFLDYPVDGISQTPSGKSVDAKSQTASGFSEIQKYATASRISVSGETVRGFPLPWSHYVRLLSVKNPLAREFYEIEALRGGWTVKQLNRQIGTQFYERTALSRNKAAMLTKGQQPKPASGHAKFLTSLGCSSGGQTHSIRPFSPEIGGEGGRQAG